MYYYTTYNDGVFTQPSMSTMKLHTGFKYRNLRSDPVTYTAHDGTQNIMRILTAVDGSGLTYTANTNYIYDHSDGNRVNGLYPNGASIGGSGGNGRWNL